MRIGQAGLDLIKSFEGLALKAYLCPAGVPTIGYGHTRTVAHADVAAGRRITQAEAEALLRADLEFFEAGVTKKVRTSLRQNQFDALVSFAYNVGLGAFGNSTLLAHVNARRFDEAAAQFAKWTRAGGRVLPGLVRRRKAESELFKQ